MKNKALSDLDNYKNPEEVKYDFLENIDTEAKAYVLGVISNRPLQRNELKFELSNPGFDQTSQYRGHLNRVFHPYITFSQDGDENVVMTLKSQKLLDDSKIHLNEQKVPTNLREKSLISAFVRGMFESSGFIDITKFYNLNCSIYNKSEELRNYIFKSVGCGANNQKSECVDFWENDVLDFLCFLYENNSTISSKGIKEYCKQLGFHSSEHPEFTFTRTLPEAVAPFKQRASDSGFDLTLVKETKRVGNTVFYDTGIAVQSSYGWYFEMYARSSISKSGYIMANSVAIIDSLYTGSILVALIKVNPEAKDLELPCKMVQLVPKKRTHFSWTEVEKLNDTSRGAGGFGSTGK